MDEFFGSDDDDSVHKETAPAEAEEDIFGSDDEDTNGAGLTQDAKMEEEELFGSENEGENTAVNADSQPDSKQKEDLDGLFGSDDEAPAAAQTKVRTQSALSLPALKKSIPAGAFGVSCTMPNFVKIQPRPYVPGEHLAAEEEERFQGAIDMVRWRFKRDEAGKLVYDKDGKVVKESNARLVKWTDGSYQLIVGSTVFQAEMLPVHDSYGYAQLKSEDTNAADEEGDGEKARPPQSCLNSIGKIDHKVKILPSSVHSEAHTRMSLKVTEKYLSGATSRQIGYKHHTTIKLDPEKEMEERIKAEEVELRKNQKRKMMENGGSGRKKYSAMSARYLEEGGDDDAQYDSTSLSHLKRGSKRNRDYGSSGEESIDNRRHRKTKGDNADNDEMDDFIVNDEDEEGGSDEYDDDAPKKSKIRKKAEEEEEEEEEDEDVFDDAEEDVSDGEVAPVKATSARSKRMIVDSDEDD